MNIKYMNMNINIIRDIIMTIKYNNLYILSMFQYIYHYSYLLFLIFLKSIKYLSIFLTL